jgi:acetyl-CoA carboxylase carboxyltransferase component
MVWQPEVDELERRRRLAEQMGGPEAIARQHDHGKLTVRERVDAFADPRSFQEIGVLAGTATYKDDKLVSFTPANSVAGLCTLNGRKVVVSGGDFTVRGGAADASVGRKSYYIQDIALQWRLPYIRLLDATGGSVRTFEQLGRTYIPDNPGTSSAQKLLCTVPVVSAVLGSVAGLPAVEACLAHFNLMVKGTTQVFAGGPPVVKAALGYDITKEELGDERTQVYQGGVIDNLVENEQEAFAMIRRFLSYMPDNVWEMPPRIEPDDDPS